MQLDLNFGGITLIENGDVEHINEYPENNHIYFTLECRHGFVNKYTTYEFTYRYVRYRCSTNHRDSDKCRMLSFIINNLNNNNNGVLVNNREICVNSTRTSTDIKSLYEMEDEVIEVIDDNCLGGYCYYVSHDIKDLDVVGIIKNNRYKYNISDKNISLLESYNGGHKNLDNVINKIYEKYKLEYHEMYGILNRKLYNRVNDVLLSKFRESNKINIGDIVLNNNGRLCIITDIVNLFFTRGNVFKMDNLKIDSFNVYVRFISKYGKSYKISEDEKDFYVFNLIHNFGSSVCWLNHRDRISELFSKSKEIYENYYENLSIDNTEYYNNKTKTYLMKNMRNGLYKIGKSTNPSNRERTLQGEDPHTVIVKIWDYDIEEYLHKEYNSCRVRGEWFKLNKVQVKYLCTTDWIVKLKLEFI